MKKLVVVAGPTASGKSNISVMLAEKIKGSVISGDSMQVYKGMDIGTAKITKEEMRGIPHYLIDIRDPKESFSVAEFKAEALKAANDIYAKRRIPILAGGTGFYIQSLVYDIDFKETKAGEYRTELENIAEEPGGIKKLHDMLGQADPESAKLIHPNNVKRVIRALEYYHDTGEKISVHNAREREKKSPYDLKFFVLDMDRNELYHRIDKRVGLMMDAGLVDEVKGLKNAGLDEKYVSMQGIGYKEILDYLDGRTSLDDAVELIKKRTRNFAKRQLTWFRREKKTIWINKDDFSDDSGTAEYIYDTYLRDWFRQDKGELI